MARKIPRTAGSGDGAVYVRRTRADGEPAVPREQSSLQSERGWNEAAEVVGATRRRPTTPHVQ